MDSHMDYHEIFATMIDLAEETQQLHVVSFQASAMRGEVPSCCIAVVEW